MATFRKVHVSFWGDPYIQSLSPEQKYFYLYLLTNERTKQCGIYEISKKQISYDTGYNVDTVSILLKYFISCKKIFYSEATSEVAIRNWRKFNDNPSPKVQVLVNQEIKQVKDKSLIQYLYPTDTVSIDNPQEEEEKEVEEEKKNKEESSAGEVPSPYPLPSSVVGYNQLADGRSYIAREMFFTAKDFGALPTETLEVVKTLLKIVKNIDVTENEIIDLWGAFKHLKLTFQKPYRNTDDVYEHFSNWCKTQSFRKGATPRAKKPAAEALPPKPTPNLQNLANRYD